MERNAPEIAGLWRQFVERDERHAFDRLFVLLANAVFHIVRAEYPGLPPEDVEDAVAIAFQTLAARPDAYDSGRGGLQNYLITIAKRRCIDLIRHQRRRVPNEESSGNPPAGVALGTPPTNISRQENAETDPLERIMDPLADTEGQALLRLLFRDADPTEEYRPEIRVWLERILPVPADREFLRLLAEGRASVAAFAQIYGIEDHPVAEQQEMKRHRERIEGRLKRRRESLKQLLQSLGDL